MKRRRISAWLRMRARSQDLLRVLSNASDRLSRKINIQRAELEKCAERDQLRICGDRISANLYQIEKGSTVVSLQNFYEPDAPLVKIKLDPSKTPSQNAQKYYKDYRKARTAEEKLTEQIGQAQQELEYLDTVFEELSRAKVERDLSIGAAGGMIIQMLPGAEEAAVDALEEMIGKMEPLTTSISRVMEETPGLSQSGIVRRLMEEIFADMPEKYRLQALEEREIRWECDCSRERMARALATIGKEDMREIIEEDGKAELQCHFCLKKYDFSRQELTEILNHM